MTRRDSPGDRIALPRERALHALTEAVYGALPGRSYAGYSRWGGKDLTPGFVAAGPDPRTEAHLWAKEVVMVGQRPPFQREAWAVHATRMGLDPDGIAAGWKYITNVFSKKFERTERERVRHALQEFSGMWGGYYMQPPHELKIRPQGDREPAGFPNSWPWATKEAEAVFKAAEKYIATHPDTSMETAFEAGIARTGLSVFDLTPEDDALMGMALQWAIMGKDAAPQPPAIPTARAHTGMKGTQGGMGHELAKRGAP